MSRWGGRKVARLLGIVLAEYGPRCHLCQRPIRLDLPRGHRLGPSVDHVIARKYGGGDDLENLRPAHRSCNSARGARPLTATLLAQLRGKPAETTPGFFR